MEAITKFFEYLPKYAWIGAIVLAFLLSITDETARSFGVLDIRLQYLGMLWISFFVCILAWIASIAAKFWIWLKRYLLIPMLKISTPQRCLRTGIKQSRMRYHRLEYTLSDGQRAQVYLVADSNGQHVGYCNQNGEVCLLPDNSVNTGADSFYQTPSWAKVDWRDVFSGDRKSGCWAIEQTNRAIG
jgi:hypothetical protein